MPKRSLEDEDKDEDEFRSVKRVRPTTDDLLSRLSDELLIRILSFLPITDLNICQRTSQKFKSIAADSQLWKALYYNRFVRPRASRLPGIRDAETAPGHLYFSSKLSKWLDDDNLVKRGQDTNWKKQYKLRDNWTKGNCNISEIEVAEQPPIPPLLVRMHDGIVYTADVTGGLRAWSSKKVPRLLACVVFDTTSPPTSMALDVSTANTHCHHVAVGFEDGAFKVYTFDHEAEMFLEIYAHTASSNGMLSAVAYCSPYLVTMTAAQLLSLYQFPANSKPQTILDPPRLLHSLLSHTVYPPLSLAIRSSSQNIVATIAFAFPSLLSGWGVGIQEIWLSPEGALFDSRLAMSSGTSQPAATAGNPVTPPNRMSSSFSAASVGYSKPTSLSYSHPYLLLSHPDNTLTLYLVTSSDKVLSIASGSRLWGHTSSVSGAHVGGRGKAVSVSSRGDELRIWELEGTNRRRLASSDLSVRVQGESLPTTKPAPVPSLSEAINRRESGLGIAVSELDDLSVVRGWIGFDEENVVVLKERNAGSQSLVVYDFT